MDRDRTRLVVLLVAHLALVVIAAVVMNWFELSMAAGGMTGEIGIGLRTVSVCQDGVCASISFSGLAGSGSYPLAATITFWGSLLLAALVVYLAATRIVSDARNEGLSRTGMLGGGVMILGAGAAGFLFAPDGAGMGAGIERTWAPVLLIAGHLVGIVTMHLAAAPDTERGVAAFASPPAAMHPRPPAPPAPLLPTMPAHLRNQLRYTALSAELTLAGLDARREDGASLLVLWRDVVGVVARRLPPEHGGATFLDLVSTAGATLRVLPWTRLTGEALPGAGAGVSLGAETGADEDRARALVAFVTAHCPQLKLDPVTREFLDGTAPPRQLPDVATLATHDEHLA